MVRILGMDWAPSSVPLERRLQTIVIMMHVLNFTLNPTLGILVVLYMLTTKLWFVSVGYVLWVVYDVYILETPKRGGRRSDLIRSSAQGRYFRDYFPISLVKTASLDPDRNYVMGSHPHGIIGCGALCNFGTEVTGFSKLFPGIKPHMLTLEVNFRLPLLRAYVLFMGLCDASKESIRWILGKQGNGNATIIVIGGAAEALSARPGSYDLTLRGRKGFVRMALETGSDLVPVYSFGENDLYKQADNPKGSWVRKFQDFWRKYVGYSPPFFYGRGVFNYTIGLLPYRTPIVTVVGAPIRVPKIAKPSKEVVDDYHQRYMDALSHLFNDHKTNYGIDDNMYLNFI